jgi:hypothetical protein
MMPWFFSRVQVEDPEAALHIAAAAKLINVDPDTILCGVYASMLTPYLEPDEVKKFALRLKRRKNYTKRKRNAEARR